MSETIETKATETQILTISDFMTKATSFLEERCVPGTAQAVSRGDVAKAGGLTDEGDTLISALINAGFMPGWKIRQGRDGGVCRVGEEPSKGPNPNKYGGEWLVMLMSVLNQHVSLNPKVATPRNVIARELAKVTEEDVLTLPNKISEAISLGKCPGFESKRGSGILRKEVAKVEAALVVSADAEPVESETLASETLSESEVTEVTEMLEAKSEETVSAESAPEAAVEETTPKAKGGRKNRK